MSLKQTVATVCDDLFGLFSLILQLNLMMHIKMEGVYRFFKISFKNHCSTVTE